MDNILLIDADSKIPNLALMKISTYYRDRGHNITLWRFGFSGYNRGRKGRKTITAAKYDKVFVSVIFRCNRDIIKVVSCDHVDIGGSGYDIKKKLPPEIDCCPPDYSIYPENRTSYGFITRGCIRNCGFCIVPEKEGRIYKETDLDSIIEHDRVEFLDNNILAYRDHKAILQRLIDKKIKCSFSQGLDIRLVDDENARLLSRIKHYIKPYTFAFDNISSAQVLNDKLDILLKYIKSIYIRFYIYCSAEMDLSTDVIPRIAWCKKNKCLPYLMRDDNCYQSTKKGFYADLAAWCNQPSFFKKMTFKEFLIKRGLRDDTLQKRLKILNDVWGYKKAGGVV
ncbi:MAG: hypothetical protein KAS66_00145 [Candidatus Omnitrophica bacterium]|nr:hypothetical protein [Candidatus Omnitrophota bacterium]